MADFNENNINSNEETVSGVEPAKKKKGAVIGGIAAGAVAVIVGGSAAAYGLSDFVKNQVKLRISKPENYYAWVMEKNSSNLAAQVKESYQKVLDEKNNGQVSDVSLKFEPSQELIDLLSSEAAGDDELTAFLENFKDVKIGVNGGVKENTASGSIYADWNGSSLIALDFAADADNGDFFLRLPDLKEQWIVVDGNESGNEMLEKALAETKTVISPEEIESEINKYTEVYNNVIDDVKVEKKEEIAIGDINVNYSVVSVEMTEKKCAEATVAFLEAARDDEVLKRIYESQKSEYDSEYNDLIDDTIENYTFDEDYEYSDDIVTLKTYIDPAGSIRGFEVNKGEDGKFYAVFGKDGENIKGEVYITEDEKESFRADVSITEQDDVYNGNIVLTSGGEEVSVEFTDLKSVNEEKGYISGTVTLNVDESVIPLEFSSDGDSQQISFDVNVEGENYTKITAEISENEGGETTIPEKSEAFAISDTSVMSDYIEQEKFTDFICDIMTKLGISDASANESSQYLSDLMYGVYNYSGDDYDTDFGGWDDDEDFTFDDSDLDFDWDTDDDDDSGVHFTDSSDEGQAEEGEAYIALMDGNLSSYYLGGFVGDNLASGTKKVQVAKDGKYTVSVTADTSDYNDLMSGAKPNGLYILSLEFYEVEGIENADVTIDSIKIDGTSMAYKGTPYTDLSNGMFDMILYSSENFDDGYENFINADSIGEWTDIEITFEVSGLK